MICFIIISGGIILTACDMLNFAVASVGIVDTKYQRILKNVNFPLWTHAKLSLSKFSHCCKFECSTTSLEKSVANYSV